MGGHRLQNLREMMAKEGFVSIKYTYMLFKRNVVINQCFRQQNAVLKMNISVRHPVSQKKSFSSNIFCSIDQTSFLIAAIILRRKGIPHVTFGVRAL